MSAGAALAPRLFPDPSEVRDWRRLSDEDLIVAFHEGWGPRSRGEAADELFRRHQGRVLRWCCRFTRDREAALDLTQDIFLRAYRNLDRYRGECRFSTWLYVITRNLCVSAVQRKHAEPLTAVSPAAHDFADASADVHALVERRDRRRRQWGWIVETLDRTEARVMLLHYGEELPLRAVSRVLGLTNKSGAKAYIVSARRKLTAATHLLTRAAQCTRY